MSDEDAARNKKRKAPQIQYGASIDIGRKNFCAMVSDNPASCPFFIRKVFDGITDSAIWNTIKNPAKNFAATSSYVDLFQKHAASLANRVITQCQEWNVTTISVGTRGFVKGIVPSTRKAAAFFLTDTASHIGSDNFDLYFSMEFMNALRFRASFHDIAICFIDEKGTSRHQAFPRRKTELGPAFTDRDLNAALNIGTRCFGEFYLTSIRDGQQFLKAPIVLEMPFPLEDVTDSQKEESESPLGQRESLNAKYPERSEWNGVSGASQSERVNTQQSDKYTDTVHPEKISNLCARDVPTTNLLPLTGRSACENRLALLVDNPVRIAGCSNVRRGIA